jgi:hypothetical protein
LITKMACSARGAGASGYQKKAMDRPTRVMSELRRSGVQGPRDRTGRLQQAVHQTFIDLKQPFVFAQVARVVALVE